MKNTRSRLVDTLAPDWHLAHFCLPSRPSVGSLQPGPFTMTTSARVAAAGSPVRAVSRLPSLKSPTGFTERVVVGRSTAQWLHATLGLTGFGPLDTPAQLHQVGDRETKQPVESYLALAEVVE